MKRVLLLFALAGCLASCDSFLTRYPEIQPSPQTYFNTEEELKVYINGLYSYLPGDGIFRDDFQSDNVVQKIHNTVVAGQHTVPASAGWNWSYLRKVNFYLAHDDRADVETEVANHYAGIARFFRAWFYFDKVQRYGKVRQTGRTYFDGTLPLLFNLDHDPSEKYNVASEHPEVVARLQQLIEKHRTSVAKAGTLYDRWPMR